MKSIISTLIVLLCMFVALTAALPTTDLEKRQTAGCKRIHAYSEFKRDPTVNNQKVDGFVWYTQMEDCRTIVTGQWNTGFTDTTKSNYQFLVGGPSHSVPIDLTGKFTLIIQNGGTAPWTTTVSLRLDGPKPYIGGYFLINYKGAQLGRAIIQAT